MSRHRSARSRLRARLGAAVAAVVAAIAGCGVGQESRPNTLDRRSVPFGLLDPGATTTTTAATTPAEEQAVAVQVYLMGAERLQPVVREVTAPPTVARAIAALFAGDVTDEELAAGLRSAINPNVELRSVHVQAGVATIDLDDHFLEASTQEQRVALAQMVFTATGIPGVTGVRITLDGELREVPTDRGSSTGPLRRDAFSELAPFIP